MIFVPILDKIYTMNDNSIISAIVLSGGKSSRYGEDKCDLLYKGETFLNHQINKIRNIGINDIIACGYHGDICDTKVVADNILKGPLSGLYFGLKAIKNDRAFVVSVDVPLIKLETIQKLIDCSLNIDSDIAAVKHNGNIEPLVAIYKKDLYNNIERLLTGDNYSMMRLLDNSKTSYVEIDEDAQFLNVNYKDDYNKLIGN